MAWTGPTPSLFKSRHRVKEVHIDGLALLKLVKHCQSSSLVAGSLLGLDVDDRLEITHCFPVPGDDDSDDYQMDMMKTLREVNVDNNCVGWYKSFFASFCQTSVVETQFQYQENLNENCVVILYDRRARAYRLTDEFMQHQNQYVSQVLEELPLKIRNPGLITAFLFDVYDAGLLTPDRRTNDHMELYLDRLASWVDDLVEEHSKFQYYLRNLNPRWRKDDDDAKAPPRLDSLLISTQINQFANHIQLHSTAAMSKLTLTSQLAAE